MTDRRALYVEDDADTREMVKVWLRLHGFQVTAVCTASEALGLVKAGEFHVVILDNWLPEVSGVSLCRQIRALGYDLPVIFVSGAAYESDIQEAIAAGAQGYLTKPVDLSELLYTVNQLVSGRSRETTASVASANINRE